MVFTDQGSCSPDRLRHEFRGSQQTTQAHPGDAEKFGEGAQDHQAGKPAQVDLQGGLFHEIHKRLIQEEIGSRRLNAGRHLQEQLRVQQHPAGAGGMGQEDQVPGLRLRDLVSG